MRAAWAALSRGVVTRARCHRPRVRGRRRAPPPAALHIPEDHLCRAEQVLGHPFQNRQHLATALTHCSVTFESLPLTVGQDGTQVRTNNQRLEFLGDSVLAVLTTDALYAAHPDSGEGDLSQRRATVVSTTNLARVALFLKLGPLLIAAPRHRAAARRAPRVLASALEALMGAVFLDGGYAAVRKVFEDKIAPTLLDHDHPLKDYKSTLLLGMLSHGVELEFVTDAKGPPHRKRYTALVRKKGGWPTSPPLGIGEGGSKKSAQQIAAREACAALNIGIHDTPARPLPIPVAQGDEGLLLGSRGGDETVPDSNRDERKAILRELAPVLSRSSDAESLDPSTSQLLHNFLGQRTSGKLSPHYTDEILSPGDPAGVKTTCWLGSVPIASAFGPDKRLARREASGRALLFLRLLDHNALQDVASSPAQVPDEPSNFEDTLQRMRDRGVSRADALPTAQLAGLPSFIVPKLYGGGGADMASAIEVLRRVAALPGCFSSAAVIAFHYASIGAALLDSTCDVPAWTDILWDLVLQGGLMAAGPLEDPASLTVKCDPLPSGRVMWTVTGTLRTVYGTCEPDFYWACAVNPQDNSQVYILLPNSDRVTSCPNGCRVEGAMVPDSHVAPVPPTAARSRAVWSGACMAAVFLGATELALDGRENGDKGLFWQAEALLNACVKQRLETPDTAESAERFQAARRGALRAAKLALGDVNNESTKSMKQMNLLSEDVERYCDWKF